MVLMGQSFDPLLGGE